ncbi:DUF7146 domain-containing protein [Brevundimonas sp.]|uniref:DUF7146 domain-containing protein n=1 Tax=Brevundimonas sp. TaxID=1871086 RepID=UPI002D30E77B|nr:CHC2 zinc finger domain-containing protein [Brevundimonas sp.]HYD26914.1 CHC2 zinc finger domain-containing protein [Brevundimonas sp.]
MAERSMFDDVHERVSLEDFAGQYTKLSAGKNERRGVCPICQSGKGSKSAPFAVYPAAGRWRCWADCDRGGDVVDLYRELHKAAGVVEAVRALMGGDYRPPAEPVVATGRPAPTADDDRKAKRAAEMWDGARAFEGSLAERYLVKARGIAPEVVAMAAPQLHFHPSAKAEWVDGAWKRAPAMLLRVQTPAGFTGGVHATFLLKDGSGRDKALGKKMLGPQMLDGVYGGGWLIGPDGEGDLAVAEGIETTLSLATIERMRTGRPMRAVAALSLGRLQGGVLRDADGCIDVDDPQPDPARPPFTWPAPEASPWARVVIGVDRDMSPWRVKGRAHRAGRAGVRRPLNYLLDSEARASMCARLAVAAWTATGARASAVAPSPGADFNTELQRVLRAESERAA